MNDLLRYKECKIKIINYNKIGKNYILNIVLNI